jgi:hypothetical protein
MTVLHKEPQPSAWLPAEKIIDLSDHGIVESWCCVDCGVDTAPGCSTRADVEEAYRSADYDPKKVGTICFSADSEIYIVKDAIWKSAGMEGWGGCLCIGCLEHRIGRRLRPKDFPAHSFNDPDLPCTERLRGRRGY